MPRRWAWNRRAFRFARFLSLAHSCAHLSFTDARLARDWHSRLVCCRVFRKYFVRNAYGLPGIGSAMTIQHLTRLSFWLVRLMRLSTFCAFVAHLIFSAVAHGADIMPADTSRPLFRIFAPIPMKLAGSATRNQLTFDDKHPLLVVRSVSDVRLARDQKGVLITLTPADTKKFAEITRKNYQGLLLLEANGRMLEALYITAPIVNGMIGFKHPEEAEVAEYLRRRFRIAEFK